LKSCCVLQYYYDNERDKTVFYNTTPDQPCPKTDGLGPHHWKYPAAFVVITDDDDSYWPYYKRTPRQLTAAA